MSEKEEQIAKIKEINDISVCVSENQVKKYFDKVLTSFPVLIAEDILRAMEKPSGEEKVPQPISLCNGVIPPPHEIEVNYIRMSKEDYDKCFKVEYEVKDD